MPQDFKEQFKEQIGFLRSSSEAYDGGNEPEAKRLGGEHRDHFELVRGKPDLISTNLDPASGRIDH